MNSDKVWEYKILGASSMNNHNPSHDLKMQVEKHLNDGTGWQLVGGVSMTVASGWGSSGYKYLRQAISRQVDRPSKDYRSKYHKSYE